MTLETKSVGKKTVFWVGIVSWADVAIQSLMVFGLGWAGGRVPGHHGRAVQGQETPEEHRYRPCSSISTCWPWLWLASKHLHFLFFHGLITFVFLVVRLSSFVSLNLLGGFLLWSGEVVVEIGWVWWWYLTVKMLQSVAASLEPQVKLGLWVCFHKRCPPSHTLGFIHMDGEGNNEGNFTAPFYLWRAATATSAHHVLVTALHSSAGCTLISRVSRKGRSLMLLLAESQATTSFRASPAGILSLPGLFGLHVQPGTLHKWYSNEKLQMCRQKCLLGLSLLLCCGDLMDIAH